MNNDILENLALDDIEALYEFNSTAEYLAASCICNGTQERTWYTNYSGSCDWSSNKRTGSWWCMGVYLSWSADTYSGSAWVWNVGAPWIAGWHEVHHNKTGTPCVKYIETQPCR